ncbi:MAG: translesion error-prone DNA polymerase V autoproteolytic subunit [Bacteroidota bacterium]|nr:translesion error-prone DNA polymerase V autoproteolytic subunit [Bacteroidota bacterium]
MKLTLINSEKHLSFYTADTLSSVPLPFSGPVSAGFPSPAEEYTELSLDLNQSLIKNPSSTFYARVKGHSMIDAGIKEGDILIIDKSLEPGNGKKAVCYIDGEFTLKTIKKEKNKLWLMPANETYQPIEIKEENDFTIWGIVTYVIHKM